jgi:hypothetical protein
MTTTQRYTESELRLLDSWKERAGGWRWLHYNAMNNYKNINSRYVYSSIVLSTLAGAGGFSTAGTSDSLNTNMGRIQFYMGYVIGATNVIIGLINSFMRFGKAAEKTELHASAAMQYAMLYRLIETELNLSDEHKRNDLVVTVRQEMDRLLSQSPSIPQKIVDEFNRTFPDMMNKPDVCNGLGGYSPEQQKSLPSELLARFMTPPATPKRGGGSDEASSSKYKHSSLSPSAAEPTSKIYSVHLGTV